MPNASWTISSNEASSCLHVINREANLRTATSCEPFASMIKRMSNKHVIPVSKKAGKFPCRKMALGIKLTGRKQYPSCTTRGKGAV